VVFSLSLLMLWENWNRYSNPPQPASAEAASPTTTATKDVAVPQVTAPAPAAVPGAELPATGPSSGSGQIISLSTDLLKLEINTLGGDITRVELLQHQDDKASGRPVVLLQKNDHLTYVAQSGLIGGDFPNHRSAFVARDGVRDLGSGDTLQLVLDSEQGGVRVTKTYTLKRGEYDISIQHSVENRGPTAITPSLYAQLVVTTANWAETPTFTPPSPGRRFIPTQKNIARSASKISRKAKTRSPRARLMAG